MGITFAGSTSSAGAPDVEAGVHDAVFQGVEATTIEKSQFDPNVFEWSFGILDSDGEPLYEEGEPVIVTGVTSRSVNVASKTTPRAVRWLKSILTAGEFAQFSAGEGFDADALIGRRVQLVVVIKDSGWPKVDDVLPARKVKAAK